MIGLEANRGRGMAGEAWEAAGTRVEEDDAVETEGEGEGEGEGEEDKDEDEDEEEGEEEDEEEDEEEEDETEEEDDTSDSSESSDDFGHDPNNPDDFDEDLERQFVELGPDIVTEEDRQLLRLFAFKNSGSGITDASYRELAYVFTKINIPSYKVVKAHAAKLSQFEPVAYDCCIKSCCCFVGPHKDKTRCPFCDESRLGEDGKPRRQYYHLPLIPRLLAYYSNPEMTDKMHYRAEFDARREREGDEDHIDDVMDGSHYKKLRRSRVVVNGERCRHRFFSDSHDVALGLSTDGFAPFQRRTKTCWPIILFNYNLPPC
ncbi:hypothetical protein K523DRAFT_317296 [Schizophyllum commune Tattone D]|nr:hypothetical protein K523DRAFT_317296 [Schizophyllum commune Tattone D]